MVVGTRISQLVIKLQEDEQNTQRFSDTTEFTRSLIDNGLTENVREVLFSKLFFLYGSLLYALPKEVNLWLKRIHFMVQTEGASGNAFGLSKIPIYASISSSVLHDLSYKIIIDRVTANLAQLQNSCDVYKTSWLHKHIILDCLSNIAKFHDDLSMFEANVLDDVQEEFLRYVE
jgi:hypothetical protein